MQFKDVSQLTANFLKKITPTGGISRAVAVLAGGSVLAQLISIIAAPISTRLYTPADYGVFSVFSALLGTVSIVASLRYELAIPLPKEDTESLDILTVCFLLLGVSFISTTVLVWLYADKIAGLTGSPNLRKWLWLLPFGAIGAGIYQALNYWALRRQKYTELAKTKFSQSVLGTGSMLGVAVWVPGPVGLLVSSILSQAAGIMLLQGDARVVAGSKGYRIGWGNLIKAAKSYRSFAFFAAGAALLNSAGSILPPLMFSRLYGEQVTGWFGMAQKVMLMPMSIVGAAVSQVFLGEAAKYVHGNPHDLQTIFSKATKKLVPFAVVIVAVGFTSPFVFPIVFGENWHTAGVYAAWISIYCGLQLIVSPISSVATLKKRQDIQFSLDLLRAILVCASLYLPSVMGGAGIDAVVSYSVVMSVMYLIYYAVYRKIVMTTSGTVAAL